MSMCASIEFLTRIHPISHAISYFYEDNFKNGRKKSTCLFDWKCNKEEYCETGWLAAFNNDNDNAWNKNRTFFFNLVQKYNCFEEMKVYSIFLIQIFSSLKISVNYIFIIPQLFELASLAFFCFYHSGQKYMD